MFWGCPLMTWLKKRYVLSGSSEPLSGCLTPMIVFAGERSGVIRAPLAAYSPSVKTRFVDGCTSTSTPDLTSRSTWLGVSGARRSHLLYASASKPMARTRIFRPLADGVGVTKCARVCFVKTCRFTFLCAREREREDLQFLKWRAMEKKRPSLA
jgi:hypothetical protein